jgi:hypothetical protein
MEAHQRPHSQKNGFLEEHEGKLYHEVNSRSTSNHLETHSISSLVSHFLVLKKTKTPKLV